jgi:IMP cyclohydrolase
MKTEMARRQAAEMNLHRLSINPYPGRGIIVGVDHSGSNAVVIYWIMGRSDSSRNRVFKRAGDRIYTDLIDRSKPVDPLTLYNAMEQYAQNHIVSNGDQTSTIVEELVNGGDFHGALGRREYERDPPNYTPRIAAMVTVGKKPIVQLGIIRKEDGSEGSWRTTWEHETLTAGYGHCIHTYEGNVPAHEGAGGRLPPFVGEPRLVPLAGHPDDIANTWWNMLDRENRVALVVKIIPLLGGEQRFAIINANDWTDQP